MSNKTSTRVLDRPSSVSCSPRVERTFFCFFSLFFFQKVVRTRPIARLVIRSFPTVKDMSSTSVSFRESPSQSLLLSYDDDADKYGLSPWHTHASYESSSSSSYLSSLPLSNHHHTIDHGPDNPLWQSPSLQQEQQELQSNNNPWFVSNSWQSLHYRKLAPSSSEEGPTRIDYSVLSVAVMTLGLIMVVEVLRHRLDHAALHRPFFKAVLQGVYAECTYV